MIKYIVTWCILNWVSDPIPTTDVCGRRLPMSTITTTEAIVPNGHYIKDCDHKKEFDNLNDAFVFYKTAVVAGIDNAKLDTIK